jgi:outer membrane protein assembly factor BamB
MDHRRKVVFGALSSIVLTLVSALSMAGPLSAGAAQPVRNRMAAQQVPQDWPTYLHDGARSGASTESILNTVNAPTLTPKWSVTTGQSIVAPTAVVGGIAYVGSWDGYEYAINASTGAVVWKTNLGTTTDPNCIYPVTAGITSGATVQNGVVYVGGGNAYWYALDAKSGAVLWSVYTGDNSPAGAHYNWSSPLIYNGYAYIGIASNCDNPLVQGQLMQVNLATHQVTNVAKFVPDGQVGAGVWTSPTVDPASNTVFVSTGTINMYTQTLSQAIVALDASTLAIKSHWQLPFEVETYDSDWGTTPTLTSDSNGRQLLSLANKNGYLYTFDRNNIAAGPIWQAQLAPGGDCPTCGDGTISSGVFVKNQTVTGPNGTYTGPVLFYASGNTVINGVGSQGAVRAFNPANGQLLWTHQTNGAILAALAYDNGLLIYGQGKTIEVTNASNGYSLFDYLYTKPLYAAPSVSMGQIFFGGTDGNEYSFGLPTTPPPAPPADANCPPGFTCQDIGNPQIAGRERRNADGSLSVVASGSGARHSADQMRLITQPVSGDFQVRVEDINQTGGAYPGWDAPQLGIMIRQSSAPGSPYYAALQDPTYPNEHETVANLIMFYRDTWNAPTVELMQEFPAGFPRWIVVQRHGDTFQTLVSGDGVNYFLIPGTMHTVVMPTTLMAGMGIGSGAANASTTATYSQLNVGAPTQTYTYLNTQHPCPAPWTCRDVDDPNPPGDQIVSNGTFQLQGAGWGIGSLANYTYEDSFHYVYQSLKGDQTISAKFTGFGSNAPAKAQAGLMMRASQDAHAPYYGIFMYPGTKGGIVQWRVLPDIIARVDIPLPSLTMPVYLQVSRYTDTRFSPAVTYYSAATSPDGVNWTPVTGSTVAIDMGGGQNGPTMVGLAGDAIVANTQVSETFTNVSVSATTSAPPGICDNGWTCADVGNSHVAGNQTYLKPTWTIQASGDLNDVYDQFRFAWQPMSGDGTVTTRVISMSGGGEWQKAGVMIRAGATDPQAPYYGVFVTPQHGVIVSWRAAEAATTNASVTGTGKTPIYLMVSRYTDANHNNTVYYAAYTSTDNVHWTVVPNSVVSLNLPGPLSAGLAATSYTPYTATSTFDNFNMLDSSPPPPGICPAAWNCADVAGALPPGTQVLNGGTWTASSGGSDIWANSDQYHFMWQTLQADGTVSAHVTAVSNAGTWAKAGVMLRTSADPLNPDPSAPYYGVFVTPSNGVAVQWRPSQDANTNQILVSGSAPLYLMVDRWTDSGTNPPVTYYQALTSSDAKTWAAVPGSLMTMPAMSGALLAGVATNSYNQGVAATWTLDSLAVTSTELQPNGICPGGWDCEDIGSPYPAGAQNDANGTWTIQASGYDIWNANDQFRFVGHWLTSDGIVSARITSQTNTDGWAKAGVMLRATNDPASPYYAVFATPAHGIAVQYRTAQGAATNQVTPLNSTVPVYLRVARWTDTSGSAPITYYTAYSSNDGSMWSAVPGSTVALSMPGTILAGLAVTSHNGGVLGTATFDSVSITSSLAQPAGICPGNMTCADIGGSTPAGAQNIAGSSWTVSGGGADIWGTADQFRFVGNATTGDSTVSAQVSSQSATNPWAKAGVMMRGSSDPAAPYYGVFLTPSHGVAVQWRSTQGGGTSQIQVSGSSPVYLQVSRWTDSSGSTPITYYAAATSSDGSSWTPVAGSAVALTLPQSFLSGVAVTSHDTSLLGTVAFNNVATSSGSSEPPGVCSAAFTCADIGIPTPAGTQAQNGNRWTVQAGGSDIWAQNDQFRFVWQTLPQDGVTTARLVSLSNTNPWSKAGLMVRATTSASAPYYAILATPGNGVVIQYRSANGGTTSQIAAGTFSLPLYFSITRSGTTFSAATSSDGVTWTTVAGSSVSLPALSGALLSGLAVTSHDNATLATAAFDNVAIP